MQCEFEQQIEHYHDGELDVATRAEVDQHLLSCPACSVHLAHLRQVTDRFQVSLRQFELEMPADFTAHLHRKVEEWMDGGILRLAMSFASVAAVVLVAATVGLVQLRRPTVAAPQSWESAAIQSDVSSSSQFVSASGSESDDADVILADLSARKGMQ